MNSLIIKDITRKRDESTNFILEVMKIGSDKASEQNYISKLGILGLTMLIMLL